MPSGAGGGSLSATIKDMPMSVLIASAAAVKFDELLNAAGYTQPLPPMEGSLLTYNVAGQIMKRADVLELEFGDNQKLMVQKFMATTMIAEGDSPRADGMTGEEKEEAVKYIISTTKGKSFQKALNDFATKKDNQRILNLRSRSLDVDGITLKGSIAAYVNGFFKTVVDSWVKLGLRNQWRGLRWTGGRLIKKACGIDEAEKYVLYMISILGEHPLKNDSHFLQTFAYWVAEIIAAKLKIAPGGSVADMRAALMSMPQYKGFPDYKWAVKQLEKCDSPRDIYKLCLMLKRDLPELQFPKARSLEAHQMILKFQREVEKVAAAPMKTPTSGSASVVAASAAPTPTGDPRALQNQNAPTLLTSMCTVSGAEQLAAGAEAMGSELKRPRESRAGSAGPSPEGSAKRPSPMTNSSEVNEGENIPAPKMESLDGHEGEKGAEACGDEELQDGMDEDESSMDEEDQGLDENSNGGGGAPAVMGSEQSNLHSGE
eukprot:g14334.t1